MYTAGSDAEAEGGPPFLRAGPPILILSRTRTVVARLFFIGGFDPLNLYKWLVVAQKRPPAAPVHLRLHRVGLLRFPVLLGHSLLDPFVFLRFSHTASVTGERVLSLVGASIAVALQ